MTRTLKFTLGTLLAAVALTAGATPAKAAFLPTGVQNDVSYNTVVNTWGWTVAYQGDYGAQGVSLADMFANATGDYVMLAAKRKDSDTFEVLAAALKTDVMTYTAYNTTHTANGAEWYFNAGSMGFAGLGDTINQSSADINGSDWDGDPQRDRLSWHTSRFGNYSGIDYNFSPVYVDGGWRAGTYIGLNFDTEWERFVLTADLDGLDPAPAPPAVVLFAVGAVGLAGFRALRRKTQAVAV